MGTNFLIVEPNGHLTPSDGGQFSAAIGRVLSLSRQDMDDEGRTRWDYYQVGMKLAKRHLDAVRSDALDEAKAVRGDSFSPGLGVHQPRDLTYKFRQVLEERRQPLNGMVVFPVNTEVSPGALHYEQYRSYSTGEAVVYRGGTGSDVPEVGIGIGSFKANCVYLVSRVTLNWLESLRINMTGLDTQARKMRAADRSIDELENRWTWNGSEDHDLYGLLNHPYMDTALSEVDYTDDSLADDIVSDLGYWSNYTENVSGGAFQPDTMLMSVKLHNALRNRRYGDNADKSIMDWFLSANPHIKRVIPIRELNDAGGSSIHAYAFVRMGQGAADASAEIVKPMNKTLLPPDRGPLSTEMFLVSGFGGLNQKEIGDNLVVYVQGVA